LNKLQHQLAGLLVIHRVLPTQQLAVLIGGGIADRAFIRRLGIKPHQLIMVRTRQFLRQSEH
jgi:hypothetical protein